MKIITPSSTLGSLTPKWFRSAIASLISQDSTSFWNTDFFGDPTVQEVCKLRKNLILHLDQIYSSIEDPQLDIAEALELQLIEENGMASFYDSVSSLLELDTHSERLILYFPFELLPLQLSIYSQKLTRSIERFRSVYTAKWRLLLSREDFRANFVDGDISEEGLETGDVPMVVKAMHLIPSLIHKKIISYQDVLELLRNNPGTVQEESIEDILPFLTSRIIRTETSTNLNSTNFKIIIQSFSNELSILETRKTTTPTKREAWKFKRDSAKLFDTYSDELALVLIGRSDLIPLMFSFVDVEQTDDIEQLVLLSLSKAIEKLAKAERTKAKEIYDAARNRYKKILPNLSPKLSELLESRLSRLSVLKIADQLDLGLVGIEYPNVEKDPQENSTTVEIYTKIAAAFMSSVELSEFVFPVIIACGSRVKGYSTNDADTDFVVFVRPSTGWHEREKVQHLINEVLASIGVSEKPVEFWLKENGADLRIIDNPTGDRLMGSSVFTHLLFVCPWIGDEVMVRMLYEKLLAPYLHYEGEEFYGQPIRELWLEEIERASLQYRLMHKGYHYLYPELRSNNVPDEMIDSQGAFWDPGYRRIATKIFLRDVFLPHIQT